MYNKPSVKAARRSGFLLGGGLLLAAVIATAATPATATTTALPPAPGPASVTTAGPYAALQAEEAKSLKLVCGSKCHTVDLVMSAPKDYEDWHATVQKMLDRGAVASDDQLLDIMDYLHQTMTRIDVNSADADELQIVLDVSESQAQSIIARRASRKFTGLEDLQSVTGLDVARLTAKARLILYQQ